MPERRRLPALPGEVGWWLAVAAAILLAFFFRLGAWPLFDLDEGAFAQATREMMASGNYLATWLDGRPRYDKPIFSYWMQALAVQLFGAREFAFRLPSALAASIWVVAVFAFARGRLGTPGAAAAALLIALAAGSMVIGRAATADAWLNLWLALTFLEIARWQEAPRRSILLRAYLWMGLGFLTKGPVAVVIPLLASLAFFASEGRWREWLRAAFDLRGWAVFLVVALPWYLLILAQEGADFFYGFFVEHNLLRFLETREGHGGSVFYYLVVLPLVLSPFAGWMISALRRWRQRPRGLERLAWIWFGVVFVLFSLSSTQLPHYILYGVTPLLLVLAMHRDQLRSQWLAFLPALLLFALMLAMPWMLAFAAGQLDRAYEVELAERGLAILDGRYLVSILAFTVAAFTIVWVRQLQIWHRLIAIAALQALALTTTFIPAVAAIQQGPVREAAEIARDLQADVVAYSINMPSFSVYRGMATERRMPVPGEVAVTRSHAVADIAAAYPDCELDILYHEGGIVLLKVLREGGRCDGA
ncbi:Polymyxin resistance protein ArnT, undecaprenyl phosphate-alpha-L-Ara4N transferase; Melittin resistance protein PqaB [Thioalkalivibrio nitratireducens DSM 14787]|uniref:Polymyxin resistance protein ArnT, undecaprenyl phosphate-alpha-L-Ara4N transferase Melittin resistance protein PqaB n=1 Tax=Thioalkalivibrio nitratireducens (strain DSM 14787 / UNIQEM 213 / ALEN2) TaxID=1255043 RepID=L0E1J9_THIND|nr:glycosyltransferase family 39 protein [Thioalkalivibrio nitratireducens]AGA35173.1 Polymyxin resistance protein ArnT, undecaprenyl phosphate-alpha-L-Ara4N transferase; Melittin resistance protein PqaB [Thioalkalivibrio nitratireducens DSM 14787]